MKRIIICACIMVILIILGIVSYAYTDHAMDKTERAIDEISASFGEGDFDMTKSLSASLTREWLGFCDSYIFIFDKDHIMEMTQIIARIDAFAADENPEMLVECKAAHELIRLYRSKEEIRAVNIF